MNQLNVGWMASDNELEFQAAEKGDPDRLEKAVESLPLAGSSTPKRRRGPRISSSLTLLG